MTKSTNGHFIETLAKDNTPLRLRAVYLSAQE